MKTVRPKPLGPATPKLALTPEEDFVLARIDGRLSVRDLVALTGIDEPRIEQIVTMLASRGAVELEGIEASSDYLLPLDSEPSLPSVESTTSLADFAAVLGMDPSPFAAGDSEKRAAAPEPSGEVRGESRSNYPPPATSEPPDPARTETRSDVPPAAEADADAEADELSREGAEAKEANAEEAEEAEVLKEQDYRKLYEQEFHPLPVDARVQRARTAHGRDLIALCFDADSRVIAAILDNPGLGLPHARLIAFHHRTGTGLELVTRRQDLLRDPLVERRLLRNPMAGDTVLGRIMASKRLLQTYKVAIDREVPELTRAKSRGFLRQKFQTAPPEERADLVARTEGRCFIYLTGCTLDAKSTAILCGKPINSVIFVQNLAKFSATPPALLAHLWKQPFVRKNVPLKKMLLQHPNMPGDVKRQP